MSIGNNNSIRWLSVQAQLGDAITLMPYLYTSRQCVLARLRLRARSNLPRAAKCLTARSEPGFFPVRNNLRSSVQKVDGERPVWPAHSCSSLRLDRQIAA